MKKTEDGRSKKKKRGEKHEPRGSKAGEWDFPLAADEKGFHA